MVWDDIRYGETSPGIGVPQWWYSIWLPLLSTAIALRALGALHPSGAQQVIGVSLFLVFILMMLAGVPIGAAMGLSAALAIAMANLDTQWFGLLAVPHNFYAGLGKYPLLAIPMFVLVGTIFNRSGVAQRLVNFAVAVVGQGPGCFPWWRLPWPCCSVASLARDRPLPPQSAG
jgi:hypothetical protein